MPELSNKVDLEWAGWGGDDGDVHKEMRYGSRNRERPFFFFVRSKKTLWLLCKCSFKLRCAWLFKFELVFRGRMLAGGLDLDSGGRFDWT